MYGSILGLIGVIVCNKGFEEGRGKKRINE